MSYLLLSIVAAVTEFPQVQINPNPLTVRASAQYITSVKSNEIIPVGGKLVIEFPSDFTSLPTGSIDCTVTGTENESSAECEFSNNNLIVTGAFPTSTTTTVSGETTISTLEIEVSGIENPNYAITTSSFKVFSYDDEDEALEEKTSGLSVTFEAIEISTASVSTSSNVVAEEAVWEFSFTTSVEVDSGGVLEFGFPSWNEDLGAGEGEMVEYCSDPVSCSVGGVSVSCTCTEGKVEIVLGSNLSQGSYTYSIEHILNPPKAGDTSGFTISTYFSDEKIEESVDLTLTVTEPTSLVLYDLGISDNTVNTLASYDFYLNCSAPVDDSYEMEIEFPIGELTISSELSELSGSLGLLNDESELVYSITGNDLIMNYGFIDYVDTGDTILFTLTNVENPNTTEPFSAINFKISDGDGNSICESSGSSIQAEGSPGEINSVEFVPDNGVIQEITNYTFSFTPNEPILAGSAIKIEFPSEILISDRTGESCNIIEGLDLTAVCDVSSNTIFIEGGFPSTQEKDTKISFSLDEITNAYTTETSSEFNIEISPDNTYQYLIVKKTDYTLQADPGILNSVLVITSSSTTGDQSNYSFTIETTHELPAGSEIEINFPTETSIESSTSQCSNELDLDSEYICTFSSSEVLISGGITSPFEGSFEITISAVTNPGSTAPSSSFQIYTKYLGGIQDYMDSGVLVTMTDLHEFESVQVSSLSNVVGDTTSLEFTIDPFNMLYDQTEFSITFPSRVSLPAEPNCEIVSSITDISCSINSSSLIAVIRLDSPTNSVIEFTVGEVENPDSTEPTDSFSVRSSFNSYGIDETSTGISFSLTTPASISGSITLTDSTINAITTYTFSLNLAHSVPSGGFIELIVPPEISIETDCLIENSSCSHSNNIITAYIFPEETSSTKTFSVYNLKNPDDSSLSPLFEITTKYSSYSVDKASLTAEYTCNSPCEDCLGSPDFCVSCQEAFGYLYNSSCVEECPDGTVGISGICEECDSDCLTCEESQTFCTSCNNPLKLYEGTCLETCPEETSDSEDICLTCEENCAECQTTSENCIECESPFYLYENSCVSLCPDYTLLVGTTCSNCTEPCETCVFSTQTCESCLENYSLYNYECLENCPEDFESVNSVCEEKEKEYEDELQFSTSPFPFTCFGVVGIGIMSVFRIISPVVNLTAGSVGILGVFEILSWWGVFGAAADSESLRGRELLDEEETITACYVLVLLFIVFYISFNLLFFLIYYYAIYMKDRIHYDFVNRYKYMKYILFPLLCVISFKVIRIIDSSLPKVSWTHFLISEKSVLYRPLVLIFYLTFIFLTLPILGVFIYMLVEYSTGNLVFIMTLDALILTLLLLIVTILDIILMSTSISQEEKQEVINIEPVRINTNEDLGFEHFKTLELTELETDRVFPVETFEIEPIQATKAIRETESEIKEDDAWSISFELHESAFNTPPKILDRIPEEELVLEKAEIDPYDPILVIVPHKPSGKSILIKKTFEEAEKINQTGEIENKKPVKSVKFDLESVDPHNVKIGILMRKGKEKRIRAKRNFDNSKVVDVEKNPGDWLIGRLVKNESDFDWEKAVVDPRDPENVLVKHIPTGVICGIRKGFRGLPRLDPANNEPLLQEKIITNYAKNTLEIDKEDVHFAFLTSNGQRVKAKRNFIGGRILDVYSQEEFDELIKSNTPVLEFDRNSVEISELESNRSVRSVRSFRETSRSSYKGNIGGISELEAIYLQRLEPAEKRPKPKKKRKTFSPFIFTSIEESAIGEADSAVERVNIEGNVGDLDIELVRRL